MSKPFALLAATLAAAVAAAAGLAAQQPRITNARVTPQAAGPGLSQTFRGLVASRSEVAWIGYRVPVVDSDRIMCCFDSRTTWTGGSVVTSDSRGCCGVCRIEPAGDGSAMATRSESGTNQVRLSSSDRMIVLFRIADRMVDRIRVFSEDCELDAGGRPVTWLEDVQPAESVALLESLASGAEPARRDRVAEGAVSAIALHGDTAADGALARLVAPGLPSTLRRKVTFWLGNARGASGLALLQRLLRDDPDPDVQKGAVFGVSQSREPGAFDVLAGLARQHASARVRSEAVFWIAQTRDERAAPIILQALEEDASAEVRKKAVFALSQLPGDAGTEALLRTARASPDPATRGEAIFWLGQKAGARAAAALTERIEQDPATDVKKKAVFALSQLPPEEGIPLLIQVARTNTNPAVRKQAMFWLGQSKDPRAIEFFAEVLAK
ncbi:MAG TPA: HEAT repeat domain-containing protein [Vicinamibacterales bacterium]|nr:HEAT repeat domain-containing protein [Vicinamibacterales bacterium]